MLKTPVVLLLALVAAAVAAAPAASVVRLPEGVRPVRYEVHLWVDPAQPTFRGSMTIDVRLAAAANTVWLNGTDLEVSGAWAEAGGGARQAAAVRLEANEFVVLTVPAALPAGAARLHIDYRAKLRDDFNAGAFRRRSAEGDWYAYTTFTAIDARRAFPCFDQPDFKTPWQLTLTAPAGNVSLANTAAVSETAEEGGAVTTRFAETRPLPSELVAFAVGSFSILDGGVTGGTAMRVIAPRGRQAEGRLAAELTRGILPRLEAYTGDRYDFGKLDHMALLQGAFGGTENSGLIQYLGRLLLVTPDQEPSRREDLEGLLAHEMAHQWFGNLVTQAGWKDVWLSEGITTWMGNKVADLSLPVERRGLRTAGAREGAKRNDEGPNARPVRLELESREEMRKVYNGVVYSKGASFLAMLEGWLGEEAVQRAVRRYVREHRHANATTADFVRAVEQETGAAVGAIAANHLDRTGVPVVSATLRCEGGTAKLALRQSREGALPVCARTAGGTDCTVLNTAAAELELRAAKGCPAWVMPNAGGSGYYRLALTAGELRALATSGALTRVERFTLVGETQAMVKAASLAAADALPALAEFQRDEELRKSVAEAVRFIGRLVPAARRQAYRDYAGKTFGVDIAAEEKADESLDSLRRFHGPGLDRFLAAL